MASSKCDKKYVYFFGGKDSEGTASMKGCVGCGVCVPACPTEALGLVRRPNEEVKPVPETLGDWAAQRAMARGLARE